MKEAGIAGLIERFADLPDPREEGRTDYDLLEIVVLVLCAVMSGAEGWDDMEDWGREREGWLRRYLRQRKRAITACRIDVSLNLPFCPGCQWISLDVTESIRG